MILCILIFLSVFTNMQLISLFIVSNKSYFTTSDGCAINNVNEMNRKETSIDKRRYINSIFFNIIESRGPPELCLYRGLCSKNTEKINNKKRGLEKWEEY